MPVEVATVSDLPALRRLLRLAHHSFCNVADEDLLTVLQRGLSLISGHSGLATGLVMADPEPRPPSLAPDAPTRIQLRALALRHYEWKVSDLAPLFDSLKSRAPRIAPDHPLVLFAFAHEVWLAPALASVGFNHIETVIYFRRDKLYQFVPTLAEPASVTLRLVERSDLPALAQLDAQAFLPFWHMGEGELGELFLRGRTTLAEVDGRIVGYSSLLTASRDDAHLARLAVDPSNQSRGLGRLLLEDSMAWCRDHGIRSLGLNTQLSNERSQALYRSAGFHETGISVPVYALSLASYSS